MLTVVSWHADVCWDAAAVNQARNHSPEVPHARQLRQIMWWAVAVIAGSASRAQRMHACTRTGRNVARAAARCWATLYDGQAQQLTHCTRRPGSRECRQSEKILCAALVHARLLHQIMWWSVAMAVGSATGAAHARTHGPTCRALLCRLRAAATLYVTARLSRGDELVAAAGSLAPSPPQQMLHHETRALSQRDMRDGGRSAQPGAWTRGATCGLVTQSTQRPAGGRNNSCSVCGQLCRLRLLAGPSFLA